MVNREYSSRYLEVIGILRKNSVLKKLKKLNTHRDKSEKEKSIEFRELGVSLRLSFEEIGPSFVKFGQLLSTRTDVVPKEIIEEFERLQDNVKPFDSAEVYKVIEEEFGMPWQDIFKSISPEPVAAGSIAQVHQGYMSKGQKVAIKVQRPGIHEQINIDIKIMESIVNKFHRFFSLNNIINFKDVVNEFKYQLYDEIDFTKEAENIIRFRNYNYDDKYISSPYIYKEFIGPKIVVMSFIDAKSIKTLTPEEIDKYGNTIANSLIHSYTSQVFEHGFFHADPHPGNILIDKKQMIYITDFGIVGTLSDRKKYSLLKLFMGISANSTRIIITAMIELGIVSSKVDTFSLEYELQNFLDKYMKQSLKDLRIFDIYNEFIDILKRYDMKIDRSLVRLGKTVVILEGVIEDLVKDTSFIELLQPIAKKLMKNFISFDYVKRNLLDTSIDSASLMSAIPKSLLDFIRKMDENGYAINLIHEEDKEAIAIEREKAQDRRISLILIISAVSLLVSLAMLSVFDNIGYEYIWKIIFVLSGILTLGFGAIVINKLIKRKNRR